ncbi:hypothetical protein VNO80_02535 [Phaseolus coccineus]|uniref:Uncharacterized protein n=1 Tax=Phaseolus coccineus TaxID=3886 RepID=A0AAN9NPV7_PHACN
MERGSKASNYSEDGKDTLEYNFLLEDYLKIQKECVSKRRKVQVEKHKREILLHEVRFLRQKHNYFTTPLIARDSQNEEDVHDVPIGKEINCIVTETNLQQESNDREEEMVEKSLHVNLSIDENRSKKKKVSWNEKVVVYTFQG